jgi:hypothetical protein
MQRLVRRWNTRGERGQILAMAALLVTALLGMVGLVVDGGFLVSQKRQAQNAADSAALAAVHRIFEGQNSSVAVAAALAYAESNGYPDDAEAVEVEVYHPPSGGNHAGDAGYVEVIIRETPRSFFIHAILPGQTTVVARGVAGTIELPGLYALLVLDEDDCSAYEQIGGPHVYIYDGGAMINSGCLEAMTKSGTGTFTADGTIDVHGGYSIGGGAVSPEPRTVPWRSPDPLADLDPPDIDDYPVRHGTCENPATQQVTNTATLQPGVYHGGLLIEGGGSATITLEPGVYYIAGGGFIKRGSSRLQGDGVLIYVTDAACYSEPPPAELSDCNYTVAPRKPLPICLEGGGNIALTAHTDGPYKDLLFWQDKSVTTTFRHAGNAHASVGAIYVPGALLDTAGGANLGTTQIIVKNFLARGNGDIIIQYNAFFDVMLPWVVLVE